uniref:Uncharacterized protein n=1 Tax=Medicago truncatula TaxID=3880 RepID=I3SLR8_MEDTR|nr:unknown [Medicago truncatula]
MLPGAPEVTPWEIRIEDFLLSVLSPGMSVTNCFRDYGPCLICLPSFVGTSSILCSWRQSLLTLTCIFRLQIISFHQ